MQITHQVTVPISGSDICGVEGGHSGEYLVVKRRDSEDDVFPLRKGCSGLKIKSEALCVVPTNDSCNESVVISFIKTEIVNQLKVVSHRMCDKVWVNQSIHFLPFSNNYLSSSSDSPSLLTIRNTPQFEVAEISLKSSFRFLCLISEGTATVFEVVFGNDPEPGGLLKLKWQVASSDIQPYSSSPAVLTPKYLTIGIQNDVLVSYVTNDRTKSGRHSIDTADNFKQLVALANNKILALTSSGLLFILSLSMPFCAAPSVLQVIPPTESRVTQIAAFPTFLEPFVHTWNCLGAFGCSDGLQISRSTTQKHNQTISYCQLGRLLSSAGKLTRTKVSNDVNVLYGDSSQDSAKASITAEQVAYIGSEVNFISMVPPQAIFIVANDPPRLLMSVLPIPS